MPRKCNTVAAIIHETRELEWKSCHQYNPPTIGSRNREKIVGGEQRLLNHALGVFVRYTAVAFTRPTSMHTERSFVHVIIVDYLPPQHRSTTLPLAKDRSGVTPEITAVGGYAPRERVTRTSCVWSIPETILGRGKKCIDSQKSRPLGDTACLSPGCVRLCQGWIRSLTSGGETGRIHGGCPGSHGRGKGLGTGKGPVNRVASHIFISRLVARDLNKLYRAQHRDPHQLENGPDAENQGKCVSRDIIA